MNKLKKLSDAFPRYDITSDLASSSNPEAPFLAKVVLTILGENNSFSKRVNAQFEAATAKEAEKKALDLAIDRIFGDKITAPLQKFPFFDITISYMSTGNKELSVGVKSSVSVFNEQNQIVRRVQSMAMGKDTQKVEQESLKNAINKLGV